MESAIPLGFPDLPWHHEVAKPLMRGPVLPVFHRFSTLRCARGHRSPNLCPLCFRRSCPPLRHRRLLRRVAAVRSRRPNPWPENHDPKAIGSGFGEPVTQDVVVAPTGCPRFKCVRRNRSGCADAGAWSQWNQGVEPPGAVTDHVWVSPFCRETGRKTSPFCRKIPAHGGKRRSVGVRRMSPFCRIIWAVAPR